MSTGHEATGPVAAAARLTHSAPLVILRAFWRKGPTSAMPIPRLVSLPLKKVRGFILLTLLVHYYFLFGQFARDHVISKLVN